MLRSLGATNRGIEPCRAVTLSGPVDERTSGPRDSMRESRTHSVMSSMSLRDRPDEDRSSEQEITDDLLALQAGATDAADRLLSRVYPELRKIAHRQLAAERTGHTFSTTDLVHEAYFKLVDQRRAQWTERAQFFAIAARAMRRILVDYARRHRALRRGGSGKPLSLDDESSDSVPAARRA